MAFHICLLEQMFTMANSLVYLWSESSQLRDRRHSLPFDIANKYGNGRHIDTMEPQSLVLYWRVNNPNSVDR